MKENKISFRGLCYKNIWHYGYYYRIGDFHYIQTPIESVNVNPLTVSQDTNLTDSNGKSIFSGDILFHPIRNHKFKVFNVGGGFAVNTHQDDLNRNTPFYTGLSDMQNSSWIQSLEIIGNIYQHEHLLTPLTTTKTKE